MERTQSAPMMGIESMYKIIRGQNEVWGVDGYEVPMKYEDPNQQILNRQYAVQKKGVKSNKYQTKKGHYLDLVIKCNKDVPGPPKYDTYYKWKVPEKPRPKSVQPDRNSYVDQIVRWEKKCGVPGIGRYDVTTTLENFKKQKAKLSEQKIKYYDRRFFYSDTNWLSSTQPGMGQYNPREITKKVKVDTTKHQFWIKKHKDLDSKKVKSKFPDIGTYKSHPVDVNTFGKNLMLKQDKQFIVRPMKYWGTEERFKDMKKTKSKMVLNVPEPGRYEQIAYWPGKEEGLKASKSQHWMQRVSKGITPSIYK